MATLAKPGRAGEAGVKPGSDLLLPKISAFLSGHSGNPNVDTMGFSVTSYPPRETGADSRALILHRCQSMQRPIFLCLLDAEHVTEHI